MDLKRLKQNIIFIRRIAQDQMDAEQKDQDIGQLDAIKRVFKDFTTSQVKSDIGRGKIKVSTTSRRQTKHWKNPHLNIPRGT